MGAQEARLQRTVSGADVADVGRSQMRWSDGSIKLREVSAALEAALADVSAGFGSGSAVSREATTAFTQVAKKALDRAEQMDQASTALGRSLSALSKAEAEHRAMGAAPSAPTPPERAPGMPETTGTMRAEQSYGRNLNTYNATMADREMRAKQRSDEVESTYTESAEVMRRIHGEPDERVERDAAGGGSGGSGGGSGAGGAGGAGGSAPSGGGRHTTTSSPHVSHHVPQHTDHTEHPSDQTRNDPTAEQTDGVTSHPSTPADSGAPGNAPSVLGQPVTPGSGGTSGPGGLTAGLGGALAGSAVMGGAVVLGGRLAGGMGATPVAGATTGSTAGRPASARPIGAGRTSGGATLGRGATTSGSPTSSARGAAAGATGTRSGTGSAGTRGAGGARGAAAGQAGSRGAAGSGGRAAGRGAAAGASGRGKSRDDQGPSQEFFATEDDWTDDEGHRAVLD